MHLQLFALSALSEETIEEDEEGLHLSFKHLYKPIVSNFTRISFNKRLFIILRKAHENVLNKGPNNSLSS